MAVFPSFSILVATQASSLGVRHEPLIHATSSSHPVGRSARTTVILVSYTFFTSSSSQIQESFIISGRYRSHMSSLIRYRSHLASLVRYRSHLASLVRYSSHLSSLIRYRSHLASLVRYRTHLSSLVRYRIHLSSLVRYSSHFVISDPKHKSFVISGQI